MRDWAYKQNEKRSQSLKNFFCQQTKEMIMSGCRRRERDLLALPTA